MPQVAGGTSLADSVYQRIRADILAARLEPGQKLNVKSLGGAYDVSLNVVRESLSRLAGEGLVRANPQLGFCLPPASIPDLVDLTEARIEIDSTALRWSMERGDLDWESQVVSTRHV